MAAPERDARREVDHDLQVRRALIETSRTPAEHRAASLDRLPRAIAVEVRELLALVLDDDGPDPVSARWYGREVGRWRVGVELGSGGHGRVFKAEDREVDHQVAAIKLLHADAADLQTRLDREVDALSTLEHPGIVRILDHGTVSDPESGAPVGFLALDLVADGEAILDWLSRLRPDRERRLDLIDRMLDALAHAHARGVVHRDLKSSNVLVDDDTAPHLIDFGIARLTNPEGVNAGLHATATHERHAIVGSLAHLAPEQVDRQLGAISPATDVHAVGLLAYRLLCGEPPYDATGSVVQSIQAVLHVPPADPAIFDPEMPRHIADWLLACLAKDPRDRPTDAGVARTMLREARRRRGRQNLRDPNDSNTTGHATGGGHRLRVAVAVVAITAVAIVAATVLRPGDKIDTSDPITNQAVRQDPGAGDTEMKFRPFLSAVVGGAMVSGSVCAQDAVQWRVEDGGNGHWYQGLSGSRLARLIPDEDHCWASAQEFAESIGAYLVTLPSAAEGEWVYQNVSSQDSLWWFGDHANGPYIGALKQAGAWQWVSGEPWSYAPWAPGEPFGNGTILTYWGRFANTPRNAWNDDESLCYPTGRAAVIEWSADCNNDGIVDYGQILDGTFPDTNLNGVPDECENSICVGDITGNGQVDAADLGILLAVWNTAGKSNPAADINGDGTVNAADLGLLLGNWGPCPE